MFLFNIFLHSKFLVRNLIGPILRVRSVDYRVILRIMLAILSKHGFKSCAVLA